MLKAWLLKIANIAASSAPSVLPGKRPRKNVKVNERKPRTGADCRMSSTGISTISARRLLARLSQLGIRAGGKWRGIKAGRSKVSTTWRVAGAEPSEQERRFAAGAAAVG